MVRHPPCLAAALAAALLAATPAPAADLALESGDEWILSAEVGTRAIAGMRGDLIQVPIAVHADDGIGAFRVDLCIPAGHLRYVGARPGELARDFALESSRPGTRNVVRITGRGAASIAAGSSGRVVVVVFEVLTPGTNVLVTGRFVDDDLRGDTDGTTRIPQAEWGKVKALYRS